MARGTNHEAPCQAICHSAQPRSTHTLTDSEQFGSNGTNPTTAMAQQPSLGQGLLIIEASRSHSDTPHFVGLLSTSDKPDAEPYTHSQETDIPASERPQTHSLDHSATGIGLHEHNIQLNQNFTPNHSEMLLYT